LWRAGLQRTQPVDHVGGLLRGQVLRQLFAHQRLDLWSLAFDPFGSNAHPLVSGAAADQLCDVALGNRSVHDPAVGRLEKQRTVLRIDLPRRLQQVPQQVTPPVSRSERGRETEKSLSYHELIAQPISPSEASPAMFHADPALLREKADQAIELLPESGLDAWLTFVRETDTHPDPGVEMIVGTGLTWISAFLLTGRGERVAIVGRYDVSNVERLGVFPEVVGYDQGIRTPLREAFKRLDPGSIGLNYSLDDHTADGLTHGMFWMLLDLLGDTPFAERLTSAGPLLARLRARKTPAEVDRIRRAINDTEAVFRELSGVIRPGRSEREIASNVHERIAEKGLTVAWDADTCPLVNVGPHSEPGHGRPGNALRVEHGHLVHIDLGIRREGYCSDLQRMWYVLRPGETDAPEPVKRAFATVLGAIDAAAAALKPGAKGWEVDMAARRFVTVAGYPEYPHGTGHGLGRAVHDGGPMLGPLWEKYGTTPYQPIEAGNIFTLELGVATEAGYVGLEEDVRVTADGCEFLSTPQRDLWLIEARG
jgi:Xaa-Pro aminopeptidase